MPEVIEPSPYRLKFQGYQEQGGGYLSHTLIIHRNGLAWWAKVGMKRPLPESIMELGFVKRYPAFREFIKAIDFGQLQLLDNTMSSITLTLTEESQNSIPIRHELQSASNCFMAISHQMHYEIAEDPERVIFPTFDQIQGLRTIDASCLQDTETIAATVSTIVLEGQKYAYKRIDHLFHGPGDTQPILDEINALVQFRGRSNIAQIVGIVVSEHPYKTCPSSEMPRVIRGFLLEYYPGGSLEEITHEGVAPSHSLQVRWAIQVGKALETLHKEGRAHLDIKPSNVVLDDQRNAFLIDISGTGGYTSGWLSPEMEMFIEQNNDKAAADAPLETRVATDCWAYGRLLSTIAEKSGLGGGEGLRSIGGDLTKANPEARSTLSDTLAMLEGYVL